MTHASTSGSLVISLDFELYWGVRDHSSIDTYRERLEGVPEVVDRLLDLFDRYRVRCTWATVGAMFAEDGDDLRAHCPENRPEYQDASLSPYGWIDSDGPDRDPHLHFAPRLIEAIRDSPGQEIGSHTFSHYYCLERGQTVDHFRSDLTASVALAKRMGVTLRSLVLPRNQISLAHIDCAREFGLAVHRGVESHWCQRPSSRAETAFASRAFRLVDSYVNVTGTNGFPESACADASGWNVPSSRFFRARQLGPVALHALHIRRITRAITRAAMAGEIFHLWWHPHNFGLNPAAECRALETVLQGFSEARDAFGMTSLSMGDFATPAVA